MSSWRYWYECPKCGTRVWASDGDRWVFDAVLDHCPKCGTRASRFRDIGLAKHEWRRDGWRFSRVLVRPDNEVVTRDGEDTDD
jgi:predicted nucleic-acid-binding Zn-ribbon protein